MEVSTPVIKKSTVLTGVTHGAVPKPPTALVTPKSKTEAFQENTITLLNEIKNALAQIQETLRAQEEEWEIDSQASTDEEKQEQILEESPLKKKKQTSASKN